MWIFLPTPSFKHLSLFPKMKLGLQFGCSIPASAPQWISSFPLQTQAYVAACSISKNPFVKREMGPGWWWKSFQAHRTDPENPEGATWVGQAPLEAADLQGLICRDWSAAASWRDKPAETWGRMDTQPQITREGNPRMEHQESRHRQRSKCWNVLIGESGKIYNISLFFKKTLS